MQEPVQPLIIERRTHHQDPVSDIELERYKALPSLPPRNADLPSDSKALEAYKELETALPNDYEPLDQVNPNFQSNDYDLDDKPPSMSGNSPSDDPPSASDQPPSPSGFNPPAQDDTLSPRGDNPSTQSDNPPTIADDHSAQCDDTPPALEQS